MKSCPSRRPAGRSPATSRVRSLTKVSAAACTAGSSGSRPATRNQRPRLGVRRRSSAARSNGSLEEALLHDLAHGVHARTPARRGGPRSPPSPSRLVRAGHVGHRQRVLGHRLLRPRGSRPSARRSPPPRPCGRCQATHPAGGERAPVADPLDGVADLLVGSPGRRKYECSECTGRSAGTVSPAAISACPATWPPKIRCSVVLGRLADEDVGLALLELEHGHERGGLAVRAAARSRVGAHFVHADQVGRARRCWAGCPRRRRRGRRP